MEPDKHTEALTRTIASTLTIKLASIPRSSLIYTPLEDRFERITRLARRALGVPVAAITLVEPARQWFKSVVGWNVRELDIDKSLCHWTIENDAFTFFDDLSRDARTSEHALVAGPPGFRSYAGLPLRNDDDVTIGTFCVYDVKPRKLTAADEQSFLDLAHLAQQEFLSNHLNQQYAALTEKLSIARRESMMDPLTRLWNRRGALALLRNAMEQADRDHRALTIALLDFDNFKQINDNYGHQSGDEVLRRVAAILVASVRSSDVCCRLGGDEFLLLLNNTDAGSAMHAAERVRSAITKSPIPTRQGGIPLGVSLGYTMREPGEKIDVEDLISRADTGLMKSKSAGRNRVAMS